MFLDFRGQLMRSTSHTLFNYIDLHAQRHGLQLQKEQFPRSEFTLALNLDILDAGRPSSAVRVHAGTTHVFMTFVRLLVD